MAVGYNPKIVTDGLISYFDAKNSQCYNPNLVTTQGSYGYNINGFDENNLEYDTVPDGSYVLCKYDLTGTTSPFLSVRVDTSLNAGLYNISGWFKGTTSFSASCAFAGESVFEAPSQTINITTEWQRFSANLTLANAQSNARVQLFFSSQGVDKIISIYGVQAVRGNQLLEYKPYTDHNGNSFKNLVGDQRFTPTITNHPLYNDLGYLNFDGINQYMYIRNTNYPSSVSDSFSMECVLNIPASATWSDGTYTGSIFTRGTYPGSHGIIRLVSNNDIAMWVRGDSEFGYAHATIEPDKWYHCVGTWNGSTVKIYINGELIRQSNLSLTGNFESDDWYIGSIKALSGANGNRFEGKIANAKIYNQELTAAEVSQNFNALRGRYGI